MQCAGNANTNVRFQVNAAFEQILFPWHTWARSKGFENKRVWVAVWPGVGEKFFAWSTTPRWQCGLWGGLSNGTVLPMMATQLGQFYHKSLPWRHNERSGISNHQRLDCLLNILLRRRSKKTSKLCVTGLCEGNSLVTVAYRHKRPVTRKIFPFDDIIMSLQSSRMS